MTSDDLGAEKPNVAFFEKVVEKTGLAAAEIAYVGDRYENDILPARAAGMWTVLLRRGPWGYVNAEHVETQHADVRLDSLEKLPSELRRNAAAGQAAPL